MSANSIDLSRNPIHLHAPAQEQVKAQVLQDFNYDAASFESYIADFCSVEDPGRLVMSETSTEDWTMWECHTAGDEIVIVLAGEGDFIQIIDDHEVRIPACPGVTILNPAGIWHSADIRSAITAVYITPCLGTEHKSRS